MFPLRLAPRRRVSTGWQVFSRCRAQEPVKVGDCQRAGFRVIVSDVVDVPFSACHDHQPTTWSLSNSLRCCQLAFGYTKRMRMYSHDVAISLQNDAGSVAIPACHAARRSFCRFHR